MADKPVMALILIMALIGIFSLQFLNAPLPDTFSGDPQAELGRDDSGETNNATDTLKNFFVGAFSCTITGAVLELFIDDLPECLESLNSATEKTKDVFLQVPGMGWVATVIDAATFNFADNTPEEIRWGMSFVMYGMILYLIITILRGN